MRAAPGARPEGSIQDLPLARWHRLIRSLAPAAPSWTTPPITDTSGKTNLSHDGLNPAHVPYWGVNNPTLGEFCFTMIGRADIEGLKSNVSMNAWLPQASYPCGNFSDTSSFEFRRSKGSLGHAFTMCRPSQTPHLTMSSARIGPQSEPWVQKEGQCPASDSRNNSELAVQRAGSISSSPPTAYVFGTGTPVPSPQSQSFSRSYGSILPTFLAYIVPSTRGCSPWGPDAVMSTTGRGRHSVLQIFKGRRERTGHHATCGALPAAGPYLRLSRFQGGQAVKQKRQLFPRLPPTSLDFLTLPSTATYRFRNFNPISFWSTREMRCLSGFPRSFGSTNPCASAVHMEPFPSSAFKVLI
ncbi:hypothetical protein CQW23_34739 [Capsicum baccatum]|uniref:Senescence-associated protein n=1 Tax=Capsicum baccatum TaxID=33114 RepID=A0A2G2UYD1_CAPBA|nr:hypothetical protein CQW23_34739 [Capsicum baccatum]